MSGTMHRWSLDEDRYCCEEVIRQYVMEKSQKPVSEFVEDLSAQLADISKNSLRMKVSNIKFLLDEAGIENTLEIKPLSNCSQQNRRAMNSILKEANFN